VASSLPARVDVAIVGAGYSGLSAARELARRGASVVVLERERAGWGASSRNGGQVLTGLKPGPEALVARLGPSRARQLFDISLESIATLERLLFDEAIDAGYERTGHLQAAFKPSHFEAFRDEQALLASVFHHRVEIIPRSSQRTEIGTNAYFGLLLDERSGAINPAEYVNQLAAAACRKGVRIAENTSVTRLARQGTRWHVMTSRGAVDAAEILVATNGYTDGSAPWLQRRFIPIGSYIIATVPLTADAAAAVLPNRRMAFDSKHLLHYFRLTPDNRLLFGGRAEFNEPTSESTRRCARILRAGMLTLFPELAAVEIEYAWSGAVAFTRDELPHAGRLDGAYYVGGYCGHGVAMATYMGALMARRIAGETVDHPLFDEDDRFPSIPFYRGTPWFLPLANAYFKLKDWLE
jgi:glycine/D-amino acid oxidase-like deaminating enzyme